MIKSQLTLDWPQSTKNFSVVLLGFITLLTHCGGEDTPLNVQDPSFISSNQTSQTPTESMDTEQKTSEVNTAGGNSDSGTNSTNSPTSTSTSNSTGFEEIPCGNGILEEGEECDDGEKNSEMHSCLPNCTLNVCGEGIKLPEEECDAHLNNGCFRWAIAMGGADEAENAYDIAIDTQGNIYITGEFNSESADFDPAPETTQELTNPNINGDIFIGKYNPQGQLVWVHEIGGNREDVGRRIEVDRFGNVYVIGVMWGTEPIDFDPSPNKSYFLKNTYDGSTFVAKFSTDGDFIWAFNIDSNALYGNDGWGIDVDQVGNVYITGYFNGQDIDFNPDPNLSNTLSVTNPDDIYDIYVGKYSTQGVYQWAFRVGGPKHEFPKGIDVDINGNVYITGYMRSPTIDFNPASNKIAVLHTSSAGQDAFAAKYDNNGAYIWATNLRNDQLPNHFDEGQTIEVDKDGNVYVATWIGGIVKLDPNGQFKWRARPMDTSVQSISSLASGLSLDTEGNIYGLFRFSTQGSLNYDVVLSRFANDGKIIWQKPMSQIPTGNRTSQAIALDHYQQVYVLGDFFGQYQVGGPPMDFNPDKAYEAILTSKGGWDVYVSKFCQLTPLPTIE